MRTGRKLVALVGAAVLLASCGGGGDKKASSTTTKSTQFPTFGTADPNKIDVSTGGTTAGPGITSPVPSTTPGGGPVIAPPPTTLPGGGTAATGPVQDSNVRYKIGSGDTLNSISKKLGVTVADLMALNGVTNSTVLIVGHTLKVPVPRPTTPTTKPSGSATTKAGSTSGSGTVTITGEKVTVAAGDTMLKIANRLGVSVNDLIAANPSVDPAHMPIGTKLNVPAKKSASAGSATTKPSTSTTAAPAN